MLLSSAHKLRVAVAAAAALAVSGTVLSHTQNDNNNSKKDVPKLVYFNAPGKAFPIRAALHYGKVDFEDVRIGGFSELVKLRGAEGANDTVPLGQLPILQLSNGKTYCQSVPILRWAGKQSHLYPKEEDLALKCDELLASIAELSEKLPTSTDVAEKKRLRLLFVEHAFTTYMTYFQRQLEASGGPFLLGSQISIADLLLACYLENICQHRVAHVTQLNVQVFPLVFRLYETVIHHPLYAEEAAREASRPVQYPPRVQ